MEKFYNKLFKNSFSIVLTVIVSVLVIVGLVTATTTIGTNIDTDGTLVVDGNATTSGNLIVGSSAWDAPTSTLTVDGSAAFTGVATSSDALWAGSGGTADWLDLAGGDLFVQDDIQAGGDLRLGGKASTTGDLWVSGGTLDMTTTTATSTVGLFIRSKDIGTTTVSIGSDIGDKSVGCIEMIRADGTYARAIIDDTAFNIQPGRCND